MKKWFSILSLVLIGFSAFADSIPSVQPILEELLEEDLDTTNHRIERKIQKAEKPNADKTYKVYKFDVKDEIGPSIWRQMQQAFEQAKKYEADIFLIHMNTYGGMVLHADSMRTKILNSPYPVYVFVDNNAASAGALISIACDSIYMRKGGSIGAATVVNQTGEKMPDKYQSYMRSKMRSTAEAQGRDPRIAEAMVDESVYIEGIIDSTKILTFTTSEAIKHGYCEGMAENIEEVLKLVGIQQYEIEEYKISSTEKIIGFFVNPAVSGILIMIIIGGIYFELQTPGIGFPILAAIIAATLYFMPLYLQGLADNWEIVIFVVGVILLAVEIFVIPGFGVAGISGIALMLTGLTLSLVQNDGFNFDLSGTEMIAKALFTVLISLVLGSIGAFFLGKRFLEGGMFNRLVLNAVLSEPQEEGKVSEKDTLKQLVGQTGVAYTMLRPSGKVEIEGEIYDATALTGYMEKDDAVKVVKYEAAQLFVTKVG